MPTRRLTTSRPRLAPPCIQVYAAPYAPTAKFLKTALEIMGKHYTGFLGACFFVNPSSGFMWQWKLMGPSQGYLGGAKDKLQVVSLQGDQVGGQWVYI